MQGADSCLEVRAGELGVHPVVMGCLVLSSPRLSRLSSNTVLLVLGESVRGVKIRRFLFYSAGRAHKSRQDVRMFVGLGWAC
jgi:hypothetical protein